MGLARINIKFSADLRGFSTEMQNSIRRVGALGKELQNTGKNLSTYLSLPLAAAGAAAIKFASDYNESLNKVDVAFGSSSQNVREFAKTSLESFGIAEGTALDLSANFGDMATSLGLPVEKAAAMSKSLVGLAGDLASFKNISIDVANTALSGIFTGETESLKKLGIVMTEANLKAFAFSQGIQKPFDKMSQGEKTALRYNYILSVTKNAQGDFERTGGGAANQMRIFQESLKQVGQQLGSVILPAFTRLITFVNGAIKSFSGLSDGTKTTIVAIAGVAAAIGPLLTVTGSLLTFVPNLIFKFNQLSIAFSGLSAIIVANPYIALGVAIAAIGAAVLVWYNYSQKVVTSQQALNTAIAEGDKNSASEVATLDRLYASATDLKSSIQDRKKAYQSLQDLYPAYFKNIDFENLKNAQSVGIYKELRQAIFDKARATAIEIELQKRATERVNQELDIKNKIAATEAEILRLKKATTDTIIKGSAADKTGDITIKRTDQIIAQTKLLKLQKKELEDFTASALNSDKLLIDSKAQYDAKSSKLAENEVQKQKDIIAANALTNESIAGLKSGTIAYYESLISLAQKAQKETALNGAEYDALQSKIDKYQAKIDAISKNGIKLAKPSQDFAITDPTPVFSKTINGIKEEIQYWESYRDNVSETNDQVKGFADTINGLKLKLSRIEGTDQLKEDMDSLSSKAVDVEKIVSSSVQDLAKSLVVSLAETIGSMVAGVGTSMNDVFVGLSNVVSGFLKGLGEAMIQAGLAGLALKAAFSNPFATIAAGFALVAFSAAMSNAMKSSQAFANGGIVGGTSFYGDKILARVNSGELILNNKQQAALYGQLNNGSAVGGTTFIPNVRISGQDLLVVFDRAKNKKNRLG